MQSRGFASAWRADFADEVGAGLKFFIFAMYAALLHLEAAHTKNQSVCLAKLQNSNKEHVCS